MARAAAGRRPPLLDIARDALANLGLSLTAGPLIVFFIATLVVTAALNFLAMQHVGNAIAGFSARLRREIVRNLFRARWSYLVRHPVGHMSNAISQAAPGPSQAYQLAATFLAQTVQAASFWVVALVVSWPLALAASGIGRS